jgi:hypothetical protein
MNQRIQELAEQAGDTEAYYESDHGPFIPAEFNKQKFAGLMIEQFLEIAHNNLHPQAYAQVLTAVQQRFEIT